MSDQAGTATRIRAFIERVERIESEISELCEDRKQIYAEAKADGLDAGVLRKIVAKRKRDPDALAEEQAVMEVYEAALSGGLTEE